MSRKPDRFPYEPFIENKVIQYFQSRGFSVRRDIKMSEIREGNISVYLHRLDILAVRDDEEWRIECKGDAGGISVDFNTGLGQIIRKMDSENPSYAIAMPYIQQYRDQVDKVPELVSRKLNLRWIWVKKNGEIEIEQSSTQAEKKQRLTLAAKALLPDYSSDNELAAFTVLDGESFYE